MAANMPSWVWRELAGIPPALSSLVFGFSLYVMFGFPLFDVFMQHVEPYTGPEFSFITQASCGTVISLAGAVMGYAIGAMTMSLALSKETMFALFTWTPAKRLLELIYRYQSPRFHNAVMVVGCALLFLAFFIASLWLVKNFGDLEWVRTAHSPYVYAAFGFGIYFLLVGHPWTRVILVVAVPLSVRVIVTLLGHVPAGDLTTAFVYGGYDSVVFAIGAAIASVLGWLLARRHASPAA